MDSITIRRTWFSAVAFFLIFFSLFWNGFMVVWMSIAITNEIWIMAAFGSIHAFVGLGLIYYTVALFVNKTDITVSSLSLSVSHFPLPWFGKKTIPVHEVSQLYCEEKITRGKNSTNVTYEVHVVTSRNQRKKLVSGLNDPTHAKFIEREIESTLGIQNRSVSGEM